MVTTDQVVQELIDQVLSVGMNGEIRAYLEERISTVYKIDPTNDDDQVYYKLLNGEIARLFAKVIDHLQYEPA